MVFDYSKLPHEYPRKFVPGGISLEWESLSNLFEQLKSRPVQSRADLENWLADEDELNAVIYEQKALRLINYSRQTDSEEYRKAHMEFIQELEPRIKLAGFELGKKYVGSSARKDLPREGYMTSDRVRVNAQEIFRESNIPLEKEDAELAQQYQSVMAAMTVTFRSEERTLQQMVRLLEETDRSLREEAWRLSQERLQRDVGNLDELYGKMIKVRDSAAKNAGFRDYRDLAFRIRNRFDYTPEDCLRFHDATEKFFVPLSREIDRDRMAKMGLDVLKPWDVMVDPLGRSPLAPFADTEELVTGCARVFRKTDDQLAGYFARMMDLELLDLGSRKGKAPGGFQDDLAEARMPFIFMNAARRDYDVRTLMHESGHSFHAFLMRDAGLPFYNSGENMPTEFAEVASTTMELIGGEHLEGTFYSAEDTRRSNRAEAAQMVKLFTWVATIDSFQHWVYTHAGHSAEERTEQWVKTYLRFSGLENFEGLEDALRYRWQRQLHLFQAPFYYIEYGIATLGALGIWLHYRRDPEGGIAAYKTALSLGCSRTLPELFEAANLKWDIGPAALERFSGELRSLWAAYD